ncbi:MAG: hypothetical protein GFH27_549283n22 [Chloroflexi bacterium AL-W]|nr:hypothetical protein [Chloroflexi bacterium AL-N1]NOK64858.1 hypothetical protein [Chloroflexi bacterium AL-N10]NOK76628.1 hypothetical protein [Chloroflexi bacterium AL-N5]NOK80143.1 hypothetical protein [Chloroflexi bacterium AL-W]NOK86656.1 hypothetical protein [Chloroflexi bacterium AL-N15]
MSLSDIQKRILQELYTCFFIPAEPPTAYGLRELVEVNQQEVWAGTANLYSLLRQMMADKIAFWNAVTQMVDAGFIQGDEYGNYITTAMGALTAEDEDLPPQNLVDHNQSTRICLLCILANAYHEQGFQTSIDIEELSQKTGCNIDVIKPNLVILNQLGHTIPDRGKTKSFHITQTGMQQVTAYQEVERLKAEFKSITKLGPHERGRAFQRIFAQAVEQNGWLQEESTRTHNEEIDIIVYKGREYYIIECKWEKKRVGAEIIRELYGKLSNRIDVRGIVISMSGFTKGAVDQAQECIPNKLILLFGKQDAQNIVDGKLAFEEVLDTKYKEAITKRKITYY